MAHIKNIGGPSISSLQLVFGLEDKAMGSVTN